MVSTWPVVRGYVGQSIKTWQASRLTGRNNAHLSSLWFLEIRMKMIITLHQSLASAQKKGSMEESMYQEIRAYVPVLT